MWYGIHPALQRQHWLFMSRRHTTHITHITHMHTRLTHICTCHSHTHYSYIYARSDEAPAIVHPTRAKAKTRGWFPVTWSNKLNPAGWIFFLLLAFPSFRVFTLETLIRPHFFYIHWVTGTPQYYEKPCSKNKIVKLLLNCYMSVFMVCESDHYLSF